MMEYDINRFEFVKTQKKKQKKIRIWENKKKKTKKKNKYIIRGRNNSQLPAKIDWKDRLAS